MRQREQLRRDMESQRGPARIEGQLVQPKQRPEGPCREISRVTVQGNTLLPSYQVGAVTQNYEHRCLGVKEIEALLADLTNLYIAAGYVNARVYLPQQDLSSGQLEVLVIEGRVEKILIEDGGKGSVSIGNVAPGVRGKPLNLRDFEQALDQINRLVSNNANFDIQPGSEAGDSIAVISNKPGFPLHLGISYDNQGSATTGQEQVGINPSWDNPLGFNDFVSYTYRQALPYSPPDASAWSNSLNYIIPFGYSTFTLSGSNSAYTSSFKAPSGSTLHSRGTSEQISTRFDRTMFRDQGRRWTLAATLTSKDSKSYLEDVLLSVSSRRLSVLDLDSSYTTGFAGGVATLDAGYARGLTAFHALKDAGGLPDASPRAQFEKFKVGFNYFRPLRMADLDWTWSSSLVGQYGLDTLYGSEQIMIGGIYSVRGFFRTSLAGDRGYYWRNDLSVRLPYSITERIGGSVRPYVAIDTGHVTNRAPGANSGGLTGMAVGFTVSLGKTTVDIFNARPISKPDFMIRENNTTFFRINFPL